MMGDQHEDRGPIKAAIISIDEEFRAAVRKGLAEVGVIPGPDIAVPFTEIADTDLEQLRTSRPDLVFLDLESEPHVGLKFAQFLIDQSLAKVLLGAGNAESPDLLLSAMQAGINEYIPKPVTEESIRSAVNRVLRKTGKRPSSETRRPGRVISVFSAKGGSGSTTVAANLAIEIHRVSRKRTLLVDLDLELGETALLLGMEPRFSIADLVRNFHRVDQELLASYIERHESGVELLSAPVEPGDVEAVSGERVRQVLRFLRQQFDYVIVDTPKTFNPATLAAFEEAEEAYLITTADLPSLRNLTRSLRLLRSLGRRKPDEWLKLVVNRYDPKQIISLNEIGETLGMSVTATLHNDFQAVMGSINAGRPVVESGKSTFARDVRSLAGIVTGVQITGRSRGWFSGILPHRRNGKPATSAKPGKVKASDA